MTCPDCDRPKVNDKCQCGYVFRVAPAKWTAPAQHLQEDAETEAYNEFRRALHARCRANKFDHHVMAEGLAEWISVKANAEWARQEGMGACQKHRGPHSLYQCITDEMQYWILRAQGVSIEDANVKVLGFNPN